MNEFETVLILRELLRQERYIELLEKHNKRLEEFAKRAMEYDKED